MTVQFLHCRNEVARRELHSVSVPYIELNVGYCRGEAVLRVAAGGGRIAQSRVTQAVGNQHIHRTGKRDRLAGIKVITGAPGDVTLLLVAVVDVGHLNDATDLDNAVLKHLGVHLHARVDQALGFAQSSLPGLILITEADDLQLVRVLRFLFNDSAVQHAVVDVRLVVRGRVNVGHLHAVITAWKSSFVRHFVLVRLHVGPVEYGRRVINLLVSSKRQHAVIPVRHHRRRIADRLHAVAE